jgi:hypothetical protein
VTVLHFDVDRHRRDKLRKLEQRNEYLEAERGRLQTLLGDALQVAAGRDCLPLELLQALAQGRGMNLGLAAMHDQTSHQTEAVPVDVDLLVTLLRETAP